MQNKRFKRFLKSSEEHLHFYVLYLSHLDNEKVNNNFRNLSLYDAKELQHNFIELVAFHIGCNVGQLETDELPWKKEDDLNSLLNELIEADNRYLITHEHTSWIHSDREVYFLISMFKMMCASRINLADRPNGNKRIERWFWPQLNDKSRQEKAQRKRSQVEKGVLNELRNKYSKNSDYTMVEYTPMNQLIHNEEFINKKVDKILQEEKEEWEINHQERLESLPLDRTLRALSTICNLCPTSEGNNAMMVINHLHLSCLTNQIKLETVHNLLYIVSNLYREAYQKVPLLAWDMLKTNNQNLINLTYNRLEAQYEISRLFHPSQDTAIQKNCIVSTLDLLSVTTNNFDHRVKLLKDKFSSDKKNSKDYSLELNDKQWEMLVDLAGGDTRTKINRTLNKMLKEAYKNRFDRK